MVKRLRDGRHTWIKLWCEKWLTGSTRFELTPTQRAIWIDLLALAGRSKSPGIIAASIEPESLRGYPPKWLAGVLMVSEEEVIQALNQCTATGKITVQRDPAGAYIIHICNWDKYQSEYQRQKPYRDATKLQARLQPPLPTEDRRETLEARSEKSETIPAELQGLALYEKDKKLIQAWPELKVALEKANPGVVVKLEVAKAHAWEVANPQRRKRDRPRFLTSWMARAQDRPRPQTEAKTPRQAEEERIWGK